MHLVFNMICAYLQFLIYHVIMLVMMYAACIVMTGYAGRASQAYNVSNYQPLG